ncbi:MAG: hypothetical protein ACOZBZ_01110 [Patescibacteria group bacterium]
MKKRSLPIFLAILVLILGGIFAFVTLKKPPTQKPSFFQPSTTQKIPLSYKIENIPYTYGFTDCCYCAGMTAMMGYLGMSKEQVENYWQDIKATNYEKDPMISIRLLPKYGLSDKFHVAWLNPQGHEPEFKMLWQRYLANYQKQVHFLKSEDEAFSFLKQLISQNIPVMVAYEEPPKDTFHLAHGYDEKDVYYWTLPGKATNEPIAKFLKGWKLDQEEFPYPNYPGHYTMMWLEK